MQTGSSTTDIASVVVMYSCRRSRPQTNNYCWCGSCHSEPCQHDHRQRVNDDSVSWSGAVTAAAAHAAEHSSSTVIQNEMITIVIVVRIWGLELVAFRGNRLSESESPRDIPKEPVRVQPLRHKKRSAGAMEL